MANVRQSVFASLQHHIEAYNAKGGDLIPLHIGDTHIAPPLNEMGPADLGDLAVYGKPAGVAKLRDALARLRLARGLTTAVSGEEVHVGCGCTHALFSAIRATLNPGDEALIISPFWPLITGMMRTAGVNPIQVPLATALSAGDRSADKIEGILAQAMTPSVRAIYFVTPNNPDGHVMTEAELTAIANFAKKHDLWVFADEVYADFVYAGAHHSIANWPEMGQRTVTSHSMSKSHGLAGARIGYVVAPAPVIAATRRVANHTVYNVPVAMQKVALHAVTHGDAWIVNARQTYEAARNAAHSQLSAMGIETQAPDGGSFFFFDLTHQLNGKPLGQLLERAIQHGVLLAPGDAFGTAFPNWLRLCFTGVPESRTLLGIERLGRALESLV